MFDDDYVFNLEKVVKMNKKLFRKFDKTLGIYGVNLIRQRNNRFYRGVVNGEVITLTIGNNPPEKAIFKSIKVFKREVTKVGIKNTKPLDEWRV